MKKTIIVMPVANEENTMEQLIREIMDLPYDNLYLYNVIDSYSKDRTEQISRDAEEKYAGRVKCIFFKESKGLISCYLHGFKMALLDGAEYIIEMDGGGSHSPKELYRFIDALEEGYDCAFGSRFMRGGCEKEVLLYRKLLSKGGTILSNLVFGTKFKDMTSGYEAFQRDVLMNMNLDNFISKGHIYQTEMRYYCSGMKYTEVPITYVGGESTLKMKSVTEAIKILFEFKKNKQHVLINRGKEA